MAKLNSNEMFKFQGRYALIAANFATDALAFLGVTEAQAKRFGMSFMADWGNVQKEWSRKGMEEDSVNVKISKPNKDGIITATEVDKVVRTGRATPAISIASVLQHFETARKAGIAYKGSRLVLIQKLDDWLFERGEYAPEEKKQEIKAPPAELAPA